MGVPVDGPEVLEAGPPPPTPAGRRRRGLLLAVVVVLVAAFGVASLVGRERDAAELPPPGSSLPAPGRSPSPSPSPLPVSSTRRPEPQAPVVLQRSGPPVRGLGSGQLFLRSPDTVYRIGLGDGRITATSAPVGRSAPVTFLAGPTAVLLHPLDREPGLLVGDDRPAAELGGLLRRPSQVLPAGAGRLWVGQSYDGERSSLIQVDFEGRPTGTRVQERGAFIPDGAGGLLLLDASGVRELRGGRWRLVSTGRVLAVGQRHYLVSDCDAARPCSAVRYDRGSGRGIAVSADQAQLFAGSGSLSPDGRYVVALGYGPDGAGVAEVVNLGTGHLVASFAEPNASADITSVAAWAPDSRHLAVLDDGRLVLLDPATRRTTVPDLSLPVLVGLALRSS